MDDDIKRTCAFSGWILANILWWSASIGLGLGPRNIDVNPFFGNDGEIIINTVVFFVGLALIHIWTAREDQLFDEFDDDKVTADNE